MASIMFSEAFTAIFCFIILCVLLFKKPHDILLRNWPVLGMLPGLLVEFHRIYDFSVEILRSSNLTFTFKGPWYSGMDMLFTVDQANIHHIVSSNFSNYTKGPDFKEVFDVLGDGILTTDSELWKNLRKASKVMFSHQEFRRLLMSTTRRKIKEGFIPLFNHLAEEGAVVDLQDVFVRFTFDTTLVTVTGSTDPRSLCVEMPEADEFAKALNDVGEGIMYRHVKPRFLWKLQRWVGFGQEKKLSKADATLTRMCEQFISAKREEITQNSNHEAADLLTSHMKLDATKYNLLNPNDDKFLRDTMLSFILAGRDATASALTWFFWLLSENPQVVTKIRQEINTNLQRTNGQERPHYDDIIECLNKLDYLRSALYEAMRLYPPVPFERMTPVRPDLLPSGHKVDASMKVLIFLYALGRMEAVWGQDALEFKPERWVSKTGAFIEEPSYKFFAFFGGPRSCLGKHLAMNLMKTVVVEILQNFDIQAVKGQKIEPATGPILRMKHGLRVTLTKTCSS
ncbi:unnamed protein product [Eruca vesicaria subsp. sativa]|uniref:Cytochrome P450 n=1 Tax=Eruca vesicaria subsp. sativa TaxID=29727 RepID=A0ABC8M5E0_ERUVS|nr:unnamed protein product [Eruca vesicaria subsp. sativa]